MAEALLNNTVMAALGSQGFAYTVVKQNGSTVVAANGAGLQAADWWNASVAIGPLYGAYAALELLGFAWTHPLAPIYPSSLTPPPTTPGPVVHAFTWPIRSWHYHTEHPLDLQEVLNGFDAGDISKYWDKASPSAGGGGEALAATRSAALAAILQAAADLPPLPSASLLRGGKQGLTPTEARTTLAAMAQASSAFHSLRPPAAGALQVALEPEEGVAAEYSQPWEAMLPEVDAYFEWLVANRQNRLEYILLYMQGWSAFATSALRHSRCATIVDMGHAWGLLVGIDNAIALVQQHSWFMTGTNGSVAEQHASIAGHLDWFFSAGFDFLSTESGTTEFSHPNDTAMLEWMNYTAAYVNETWGGRTYIKCHCSTGQVCANYVDPRTGAPLNFNFLPTYADTRVGIMPHTVQVYDLVGDPAPTYGNTNFTYMADWLLYMAGNRRVAPDGFSREIVFHGETAYWVNYDINVPLFLPLYGQRRWVDYAYLAQQTAARGLTIDGTNNFESGWVWGYWLSNTAAARAAGSAVGTLEAAAGSLDGPGLQGSTAWLDSIAPVARALFPSPAHRRSFTAALAEYVQDQSALLIYGRTSDLHKGARAHPGGAPDNVCGGNITFCNGMAYLAGKDATVDLVALFTAPPGSSTQPDFVSLWDVGKPMPHWSPPSYAALSTLLGAMADCFGAHAATMAALSGGIATSPSAQVAWRDLLASMNITALRATQVEGVYAAAFEGNSGGDRGAGLDRARAAIETATAIVAAQEAEAYHVPLDRVAGWYTGPTAYGWGYLWSVHSLYFWWRDYAIASYILTPPSSPDWSRISPCYLNIINPSDVGFGSPLLNDIARWARGALGSTPGWDAVADCLWQPPSEPVFPADL